MFKKILFLFLLLFNILFIGNITHGFDISSFKPQIYNITYKGNDITSSISLKDVIKKGDYFYGVGYFETGTANDFNAQKGTVGLFVIDNNGNVVHGLQIQDENGNKLSNTNNIQGIFSDSNDNLFILEVYQTKVVFWGIDTSNITSPTLISGTPFVETYNDSNMTTYLNINKIKNNLILTYGEVKGFAPGYKIYDVSLITNIKLLSQTKDSNVSYLGYCFNYPININNVSDITVKPNNYSFFTTDGTGDEFAFKNACIDAQGNVKKYILYTNNTSNVSSFDNAFIKNNKIYILLNNHNFVGYKLGRFESINTDGKITFTLIGDVNSEKMYGFIGQKNLMELRIK